MRARLSFLSGGAATAYQGASPSPAGAKANRRDASAVRAGDGMVGRAPRLALALVAFAVALAALAAPARAQSPTVTMTGTHDLASNNWDAGGIASDGTTVWISDDNANGLFAYNLSDFSYDSSKTFNTHSDNDDPAGVAYDTVGSRILVFDTGHHVQHLSKDWRCYFAYTNGGAGGTCSAAKAVPFDGQHPRGVAYWGRNSWVVDSDDTFAYPTEIHKDTDGNAHFAGVDFHTDNANPWGAWTDGRTLWVSDTTDTFVYAYKLHNGDRDTDKEFDLHADNDEPRGMWSDGTTMYVVDKNGNDPSKIYKYSIGHLVDVAPGAVDTFSFTSSASKAKGLAVSETRIYIADRDSDKVYVYNKAATPQRQSSEEFNLNSANNNTFGIWTDGTHLWALQNNSTTVYAYRLSDRTYQSGENLSLDSDNGKPSSLWRYDGNWWAVDRDDDKVYAYPGGSYDSNENFDLTDGNASPVGAWSDGVTAWVVDPEDEHFYAYWVTDDEDYGTRRPEKDIRADSRNIQADAMTSDGSKLYVLEKDTRTVYVYDIDTAPIPGADLESQVAEVGEAFSYQIPSDSLVALDGDTLTYTAEVLDENTFMLGALPAWLTFNSATRTFSSANVPDTAAGSFLFIVVTAEDEFDSVDAEFTLSVNSSPVVANAIPDQEIALDSLWTYAFPENTFTDADSDDTLTYAATLENGNALPAWLSFNAGTRTFSGTPTAAQRGVLAVTVTASDLVASVSDTFLIIAGNIAPEFPGTTTSRSVEENTAASQNIGDPVAATDRNSGDTLTYSISGTDAGHFEILEATGQLRTKGALNHEDKNSYTVTVSVSDGKADDGNSNLAIDDTITVTINVTDVNEAATISGPTARNYAENGTGAVGTYTVSDPEMQTIALTLGGADSSLFTLSSAGVLTFDAPPNFEDKQDTGGDNVYNVQLTGTDGPHSLSHDVAITVTNVNEPPTITGPAAVSVEEGVQAVGTYTTSDPEGQTVSLGLQGTDSGDFSLSNAGAVTFNTAPDFENAADDGTNNVYDITLRSADGTNTVDLAVVVTVTNKDEDGTVTLPAQPQVGTAYTAQLSDPDGAATSVTWKWQTVDSGTATDIPGATSISYTPVAADEGKTLRAVASYTDPQGSGKSAQADSANAVKAAPIVNTAPTFPGSESGTRSVAENTATAQDFGDPVEAEDAQNDTLTYTIGGTDASHFDIVGATGQLQTKGALDHETKETYTVTVTATDPGNLAATKTVTITVTDVDEAPTITGPSAVDYAENGAGTVSTYTVDDPEKSGSLTWGLGGADTDDLDVEDGVLTFHAPPDFENEQDDDGDNVYEVEVVVIDGAHRVTHAVAVTVTNVNEPPTITGDAAVDVEEDSTTVGTYTADDPENATITWGLAGTDARFFSITGGDLSFSTAPDFEAGRSNVYNVTVQATAGGHTVNHAVAVTVTNKDEDGTVTLSSQQPQQDTPFTATLNDPDGSISAVTWQWQGPPGTDLSGNGADTATYTPQASDVGNILRATVTYTDGHGSGKSAQLDSANAVQAPPPGNRPPKFPGTETGTRDVAENTAAGTDIGAPVAAEDPDRDTLTYTLDGAGDAMFDIDASSGQLSTEAALDRESRETYRVTVTATDPSGLKATQAVTITVTNVDEPPEVTGPDAVSYPQKSTRAVGTYRATDPEKGSITWTLTGDDDAAFEITDGRLSFVTPPDFDAPGDNDGDNAYEIMITATDPTPLADSLAVVVTVVERAAPPPITFTPGGGGPSGPTPSLVDYEWTVKHDLEALDPAHAAPTGMWIVGQTLWLANNPDGPGDAVFAYDLESGERVEAREFALDEANRAPRGAWSDGETVWVSDSGRDKLFAYDLESGERLPERDIELAARNRDARGLWSDGETVWVLNRNPSLFAYDLASGALLAEYALDSSNRDPQGLWSDGVTVWVSDHGAKRLFAYRLPTREAAEAADEDASLERVRDEDFTHLTRASNNSPRGIWSDGDVMYVADASDGKVYTYNMPDAIDARLASLSLSGVDIGEFSPERTEYEGVIAEGVTETVVTAEAVQRRTTVAVDPPAAGGRVALAGTSAISVTVTSADGARTKVYRVRLGAPTVMELALGPAWTSFEWAGPDGLAIAEAGIPDAVIVAYTWDEATGSWRGYLPGLEGVPGLNALTAFSSGVTYWVAVAEPVTWTLSLGDGAEGEAVVTVAATPE